MPFVIMYGAQTLHIKHRDFNKGIYTKGSFYYGGFHLCGKYLFTREQAQEIVDVNGWSMSARVKIEYAPPEVLIFAPKRRKICLT